MDKNKKYMRADIMARFNGLLSGHKIIEESLEWFLEMKTNDPSYLEKKEFINDLKDLKEQYADELSKIDILLEHIEKDYNNFN